MRNYKGQIQIWLGGLGFCGLALMLILGIARPALLIHADPRDFLLKAEDVAFLGSYVLPPHERHPISNDLIVFLLGDQAGERRLAQTGRVIGWRVHYVRGGGNGPTQITQTVTQYDSARGAQRNLKTYALSTVEPASWQRVDVPLDLADGGLVEIRREQYASGEIRISLAVNFIYLNMGVRLETVGGEEQVQLEDLIDLAQIVITRMEQVEPVSGPVPTPTPGFDTLEADVPIYR